MKLKKIKTSQLLFENVGLKSLLQHTREATKFTVGLWQAAEAYEKSTGKSYDFTVKLDEEYTISDKPTLFLVKDHGVHLMTGRYFEGKLPGDKSHICYARGCNPEIDPDWWENSRQACGGDDFAECFEFTPAMQRAVENGSDLIITMTADTFAIYYRM